MNSAGNDASHKSLLKSALLALDDMQAKLDAAQRARHAPIAVVGMGCRFPGADDPDAYWKLLLDGVDAVREAPPERWSQEQLADPDVPGPWYGGFLDKVDQFDPQFFGISPREASSMDPQQRLVLEVGWEALENAGLAPDQLVGSQTGVFLGITTNDYGYLLRKGGSALLNAYAATGSALNAAAGRLAFTLGLQGPTVAVDTACSSSLVAIHLACQSLRTGECDMALTGGVNLALSLEGFICSARWGMLAPDGRCKTFDADADGFVRGEGCGIVVLKRLDDAVANGDRILAVIRGSAINQDGRSSGLTVPNGLAQQTVIRKALADAGVQPAQIGYVETHGTGTAIGDPIEVEALGAVLGEGRTQPLVIGSVKTNVGHLESAAGVASLIKVILSLQHGTIPPHLHFHERSPRIPWPDFPLEIPTEAVPWERGAQGRLAGISGFGFSGTNAHLVVGEAPPAVPSAVPSAAAAYETQPVSATERPVHLLTLSAPNKTALGELAARFAQHLELHPEQPLADLAYTANVGRAQFAQRLSVVAADRATLQARLQAAANAANGRQGKGVQMGTVARGGRGRLAWLFSGHGGQYAGMGRQLYATQPVFRAAFDRCDALFRAYLSQSLVDVVGLAAAPAANGANGGGSVGSADSWMQSMTWSQPALFALQVALAELWRSWGMEPSAVLGHSLGQYAAAYVAGVFSLEDAVKLVAARSRLMDGLPASGMMVAVFAGEEEVKEAAAPYAEQVAIAVYNGPQHFVVSGASEAVEKLVQDLSARKIETRRLVVGQASHSPLMAPILDEFERIAAGIQLRKPQLRLISNVSGVEAGEEIATARYWRDHLAQPVRFADSLRTLQELRYQHFLEIGPQPMLIGIGRRCLTGDDLTWLPSLRTGHNDLESMFDSLGALYTHGFNIDWTGFERPFGERSRVAAPTYPFQRQRYWLEAPKQKRSATAVKPLIDKVIRSPLIDATLFETEFSVEALPFLTDHRVYGAVVSPGSCQVALALNAADLSNGQGGGAHAGLLLEDVVLPQALVIPEGQMRTVQAVFNAPKDGSNGNAAGRQEFKIVSFAPDAQAGGSAPQGSDLSTHATGYAAVGAGGPQPAADLAALRARCTQPVDLTAFYADSEAAQMLWGPSFRWLDEAWRSEGNGAEALARIVRPAAVGSVAGYALHPGLLDACFQVVAFAKENPDEMAVAFAFAALRLQEPAHGETWWCHVARTERSKFDIQLLDDGGKVVAAITGFQVRAASASAIRGHEVWQKWLYAPQWQAGSYFGQQPDYLPTPAALSAPLRNQLPAQTDGDAAGGQELAAALAQLSTAYIAAAFAKAGFRWQEGTHWRSEQIARQLGVIPSHRRLLERMLGLLAEGGLIQPAADGWRLLQPPTQLDPDAQLAAMQARWGDAPELRLLARCGPRLSEVLRGVQEPLELLFPGGDFTDTMRLYAESPAAAIIGGLISEIAARLPAGRGLQIVEVGAGSGSATGAVLPLLPTGQTRYVFTDSDPTLLQKAQERFADYPFVQYAALNIEQGPQRQGFAGGQADVVLAANVLHATRDLGEALDNVRALLQPGGQLLLLANTTRAGWIDLTFGLLDSWWRYADRRQDHPLIGADEWKTLLLAHGFAQVEVITVGPQSVLLAQADSAVQRAPDKHTWLILADDRGVGDRLAADLRAQGDRAVLAHAGSGWQQMDQDAFCLAADNPAHYRQLLLSLGAVDGVVHLWSLETGSVDEGLDMAGEAVRRSSGSALLLVQALLQEQAALAGLWLVTQDAQAAQADDPVSGVAQSGLWGMSRVITLEHPELNPICVDLAQTEEPETQAAHLYAEITGSLARAGAAHERQIAMRPAGRYVARLERFAGEAAAGPICRSDGTYLITGGLRGLGLAVATGLVDQGARRLLLLGRSAPKPEVQPQIDALAARGVHITVAQCDVSDKEQLAAVLAGIDPAWPLRGVVHSAGVLDDGALMQQSWERFAKVFAPKVQGAWNLHALTEGIDLDFFVLFSSASALLGNRGQSNYVAANAVLDAFAHYRRSCGLPALSINWGAWAEIGLAADLVRAHGAQLAAQGTGAIAPEQGVAAFVHLLAQHAPQVGVVPMQWPVFMQIGGGDDAFYTAFHTEGAAAAADAQPAAPAGTQSIRRQLAEAAPDQGRRLLLAYVQKEVAEALQMHELPAAQAGFNELGMDSLMTIDLRRRLEKALQITLPSTIAFEYPTVEELAGYLSGVILTEGAAPGASGAAPDAPDAPDASASANSSTAAGIAASAVSAADDANNVGGALNELSEAELDKLLEQELAFLDEE